MVQVARLILMKQMLQFPIMMYIREVLWKITPPLILSLILPALLCTYMEYSIMRTIVVCFLSILWTCFCISLLGLTRGERITICNKLRSLQSKILSR